MTHPQFLELLEIEDAAAKEEWRRNYVPQYVSAVGPEQSRGFDAWNSFGDHCGPVGEDSCHMAYNYFRWRAPPLCDIQPTCIPKETYLETNIYGTGI